VAVTRSSRPASRSPLTSRSSALLGAIVVVGTIAGTSCASAPSAAPAAARPSFGQSLSLAVSLGTALAAGDTSVKADFTLTNNGSATFDGCFGPAWGVSMIGEGGHDAGHLVRAGHPGCDERFTLLPGQKIAWSKKVPLDDLRPGITKVTGWVKLVDPAACDQARGCRETSVASRLMTMAIGVR
jgi:hypothetical protein